MPSVTRRASRDADHREAVARQVTDAVERLLAEGSTYTSLGVQRIAAEAGIARSTFYLYFPDKVALLLRTTEIATEELFAAAEAWAREGFEDLAALERTVAELVAQQRAHAPLLAALTEVAGYEPEVAAFWRARVGRFVEVLRRRLAAGQKAGTVDRALDPTVTAAWMAWGAERLIAQHVAGDGGRGDARLARGLATAIWATLGRT
ncbi:MAG: TetR/AcrR family transcriptional regulator [Solirubrobacterales bacterium]|nr:TetR/AcrR family transcriptional regulator [Solirubrobacterales bacterium]